jgi:hypothetical protein
MHNLVRLCANVREGTARHKRVVVLLNSRLTGVVTLGHAGNFKMN